MIPDLDKLHIEYKNSRNRTRKLLSKIRALEKKYYFLERITRPRKTTDTKSDDIELEYAIMHLFEDLNFKIIANCECTLFALFALFAFDSFVKSTLQFKVYGSFHFAIFVLRIEN